MPDHPRSRGVYRVIRLLGTLTWGSSPLARGLRPPRLGGVDGDGIIPARAGFTAHRTGTNPRRWDHPRSRGVYVTGWSRPATRAGSSPLARGLLAPTLTGRCRTGIIPARAGFTSPPVRSRRSRADHPRSRGVYCAWCSMLASRGGSSPLARGLRVSGDVPVHRVRIIPARAGFT